MSCIAQSSKTTCLCRYALPVSQFMTCVLRKFTRYGALENAVSMKYGDMNQNGGCYIIIA